MDDEEFKKLVIERLDALSDGFTHVDRRLDAVVARLDEQDLFIERLMQKVDRLANHVSLASQASEQALDAITHLSKRVTKLEYPDE